MGLHLMSKRFLLLLDEEELEAVGPEAVLHGLDLAHDGLDLVEVLGGLLKIADADGILADIGFLAAEHGAAKILNRVILAVVEDGDIHLLASTEVEIELHVLW